MSKFTARDIILIGIVAIIFCAVVQSWSGIIDFIGLVLTSIVPLVLGAAIAYVVAIPTNFLERHILPDSKSVIVANIRRPLSLAITVIAILVGISLASSVLVPALVDTVSMVQANGQQFVESIIQLPVLEPIREPVHDFLTGDFVQSLKNSDFSSIIKGFAGGSVGNITTQVFSVVSTIMTGFFGLLFSFILLTDTTDVGNAIMRILSQYLGEKNAERLAMLLGVTDSSFHNFIVRQCVEALILGSVATLVLLAVRNEFALGVGLLMGLAALVPIVGYPIGLFLSAFMVAINGGWLALLYILVVGLAQIIEATFLLPHVGDPRTVLPPVWVTVGVTIGGGVAGFIGMLVAIPVASTIRQLIIIGARYKQGQLEQKSDSPDTSGTD